MDHLSLPSRAPKRQGLEAQSTLEGEFEEQSWKQGDYLKSLFVPSFCSQVTIPLSSQRLEAYFWRNWTKVPVRLRTETWGRVVVRYYPENRMRECLYSEHYDPSVPVVHQLHNLAARLIPSPVHPIQKDEQLKKNTPSWPLDYLLQ